MARLRRVTARLLEERVLLDVPPRLEGSPQSEGSRGWLLDKTLRAPFYRHPGLDLVLHKLASMRNPESPT